MGPQQLADLARNLRARGFTASVSNITPTAPIAKAIGGPMPAPPGGSWPGGGGTQAPAKVAIIDTGIAREIRVDGWLDNVPRGTSIDPLDAFPLPAGDGFLDFDAGHGTFVAGIVQQIAPDAEIRMYRAIDSDGIASEVAVACQMIQAARHGADIINLSLGCQTQDNVPPVAIRAALEVIRELEREADREVLIVAAAGNYGDARPCWPAAFRRVVSVAGLAPDMLPSQWSSRGFWVTCSTIGQGLRSTYVQGQESYLDNPTPHHFSTDAWAVWSGTSFAAPQITGALARLHDSGGYSMRGGLAALLRAGRPLPQFGQAVKILPGI
jgi:subtilisin family serine protease